MAKFKAWLYRLMYGRYGTDKLGNVMLIAYLAVVVTHTVVSLVLNIVKPPFNTLWIDLPTYALSVALVVIICYRMFSKNIAKRRRENERFCNFFNLQKNKFRDRKTHVYRKCPSCKAVLRLPRAKGKHSVVCPRCKNRFTTHGWGRGDAIFHLFWEKGGAKKLHTKLFAKADIAKDGSLNWIIYFGVF